MKRAETLEELSVTSVELSDEQKYLQQAKSRLKVKKFAVASVKKKLQEANRVRDKLGIEAEKLKANAAEVAQAINQQCELKRYIRSYKTQLYQVLV